MEEACRDLPIDDYSLSQNTLDNVRIESASLHYFTIAALLASDLAVKG